MAWNDGLNELQKSVIKGAAPNVAVIAGPGTGKTLTLLRKALQLVEEQNIQPDKIRIVNFTNAGVSDLRNKINEDPIYSALKAVNVSTFHTLALGHLSTIKAKSIPQPLLILDDWEERQFIDEFTKMKLGLKDIRRAKKLKVDYNARWCIASELPEEWLAERERAIFEKVYSLSKELLGFTTRGELTFLWWQWLRANPGVSHIDLGFTWTHLLVDEYQDLNECEHDILQSLASAGVKLFAVGDPNQSIYESMRHAHPDFCWEFPNRIQNGDLKVLTQSYRCPASVLVAGKALLANSDGVPDAELAEKAGSVDILSFTSSVAEQNGIARLAQHLLKNDPKLKILVAAPVRIMIKEFEREMNTLGVRVATRPSPPIETDECRLSRALLRLMERPNDGVAAATVILLSCSRSTRSVRVRELMSIAEDTGLRVGDLVLGAKILPGPLGKAQEQARQMVEKVNSADDPEKAISDITGCSKEVDVTLDEALTEEPEVSVGINELEPGIVTIMTLHGSKGSQADWVFLPGVETGFFERDLVGRPKEERRRLLYVGLTRAKEGVFISYVRARIGQAGYGDVTGSDLWKTSSEFIQEISNRTAFSLVNATEYIRQRLQS